MSRQLAFSYSLNIKEKLLHTGKTPVDNEVGSKSLKGSFFPYWVSTCTHHRFKFVFSQKIYDIIILRACSYGKKLSRLARKHFDKFIDV